MIKSLKGKIAIGAVVAVLVVGGIYGGIKKQNNTTASNNIEENEDESLKENEKLDEENKKKEEEAKRLEAEKKKAEEQKKEEAKKKEEEAEKLETKKKEAEKLKAEAKKKEETSSKPVNTNNQANQEKQNKEEVKKKEPKKENQTPAKPETLADKIGKTKTASRTNQIVTVIGGKVSLWNKNDGKFVESLKTSGRVGYGGMTSASNKREGDGKTPTGVYSFLYGFGTGGNPGTSYGYKQITQNSYFVDDVNSKYYNQWYEGTDQKGEHMIKYGTQYKYGLVIGYNTSNTPGKGSAIFLHCNGSGNTAGCVSIPEGEMLRMMKEVKPGAQIIITTSEENLKHY